MKEEIILALLDSLVDEAVQKAISNVEGLRGPRGQRGKDGRDFHLEDHSDQIQKYILDNLPTEITLTEDQVNTLKEHYFNFDFEAHKDLLVGIINSHSELLKLKFVDLTEEERESLRGDKGPRGQKGRKGDKGDDGKDFIFSENKSQISDLITDFISSCSEEFKLKFSDLSETELDQLRFKFENFTQEQLAGLKLSFSDLTEEEKDGLKLKFSDLTTDDRESLRGAKGPRGQRGRQGDKGDTGEKGDKGDRGEAGIRGLPGLPGPQGVQGRSGIDGKDGKDAPTITDIRIDQNKDAFSLSIYFSDGSVIETNEATLPKILTQIAYAYGTSTTGGGGTTEVGIYKDGSLVTTTDKIDFTGTNISVTESGGKAVVSVTPSGGGGSGNPIAIDDEGIEVTDEVTRINFIGDYVTARPRVVMSEWATLDDITPSLLDYAGTGASGQVDVYIDVPDNSILKNITCLSSVYVGSFVYVDNSGVAINADATAYNTSNVIGIVESKSNATTCTIRVSGISSAIFSGLDSQYDYFLSDSTPGGYSTSVPTTSGHIKLKLGQAFGTDKFLFAKGERVVRL